MRGECISLSESCRRREGVVVVDELDVGVGVGVGGCGTAADAGLMLDLVCLEIELLYSDAGCGLALKGVLERG
jgi:hypothetical protein